MADMRLVVTGAAGRMGTDARQDDRGDAGRHAERALERPGSPALGQDAGLLAGVGATGVEISDDPLAALLTPTA